MSTFTFIYTDGLLLHDNRSAQILYWDIRDLLSNLLNILFPWSTVILEKLTIGQLIKKFLLPVPVASQSEELALTALTLGP
jgi:hypothetical protein